MENIGPLSATEKVLKYYYLLRDILKNLSSKDLMTAAKVCRHWREAADNVKRRRKDPCLLAFSPIASTSYKALKGQMENIRILPRIGFCFLPKCLATTDAMCVIDVLPKRCEIIYFTGSTYGIASIYGIASNREIHCMTHVGSTYTFLPELPNMKIKIFMLNNCSNIKQSHEYQEILKTICETSVSRHERTTCFMLFSPFSKIFYTRNLILRWISAIRENKEITIDSVWGGCFNGVMYSTNQSTYTQPCTAVMITGAIKSWSIILNKDCKTEDQIEAKLTLFKDKVKLKKHSLGFMLLSRPSEESMDLDSEEVAAIFKELFPEVPLVGYRNQAIWNLFKPPTIDEEMEDNLTISDNLEYTEDGTTFFILTYDD
ncbi:PREDICTED: uncharacterized protein LOC105567676 [Vollenhovia emeryi]|uniref:uncharacterized protein LOC105567676 n=1 Tax=Vollenhovia emeryi TaxID=411798 RepID=UPI0005F54DA1|nr:PREDICTED: uncharacterized protein LOC105567676 [Vollenhovia emeryi]